jgi:hypothetical protein
LFAKQRDVSSLTALYLTLKTLEVSLEPFISLNKCHLPSAINQLQALADSSFVLADEEESVAAGVRNCSPDRRNGRSNNHFVARRAGIDPIVECGRQIELGPVEENSSGWDWCQCDQRHSVVLTEEQRVVIADVLLDYASRLDVDASRGENIFRLSADESVDGC